jgi:hypothetical protein
MRSVGQTTDGRTVVAGLAEMYFQEGLPLSIIFDQCQEKRLQPAFILLYNELSGNGMKHDRVIHLLSEAIFDSYGKEYRDEVISRLELNK